MPGNKKRRSSMAEAVRSLPKILRSNRRKSSMIAPMPSQFRTEDGVRLDPRGKPVPLHNNYLKETIAADSQKIYEDAWHDPIISDHPAEYVTTLVLDENAYLVQSHQYPTEQIYEDMDAVREQTTLRKNVIPLDDHVSPEGLEVLYDTMEDGSMEGTPYEHPDGYSPFITPSPPAIPRRLSDSDYDEIEDDSDDDEDADKEKSGTRNRKP